MTDQTNDGHERSDEATTTHDHGGTAVLLDDTEIDPEVASVAAAAARKRAARWIRRHDIDFENGRP